MLSLAGEGVCWVSTVRACVQVRYLRVISGDAPANWVPAGVAAGDGVSCSC